MGTTSQPVPSRLLTASGLGGATDGHAAGPVADATTVVLSFPTGDDRDRHVCSELLGLDGGARHDGILVSLAEPPARRIDTWRSTPARPLLDHLHVVSAGHATRPPGADPPSAGPAATVSMASVPAPGDLTGLGIAIADHLDSLDDPGGIACCFDSLTPLLDAADPQPVFRFLHVLTAHLRSVAAAAHFHIDPTAHDDHEVRAIMTLFDREVTGAPDGGIEVRSR